MKLLNIKYLVLAKPTFDHLSNAPVEGETRNAALSVMYRYFSSLREELNIRSIGAIERLVKNSSVGEVAFVINGDGVVQLGGTSTIRWCGNEINEVSSSTDSGGGNIHEAANERSSGN